MDIGVCMSRAVLAQKLEARTERNPEEAWNLVRWPQGLSEHSENRLFVACDGRWLGYFKLSPDALYNPEDRAPYTLLFDTRTWTPITPSSVKRFRGFTYEVPAVASDTVSS